MLPAAGPDYSDRTGHVIVCGLHGVGLRVVEQFVHGKVGVVVIDDDPDRRLARQLQAWGVDHVAASSRLAETLVAAGLAGALALICTEDDDVHTLETALLARRLRTDVRIVVQLRNAAVGSALAEITGPGSVLDTATLAAPSILEACLRRRQHTFELAGEHFATAETVVTWPGTLRGLFGDLAPVAVVPADGTPLVVCPGRDHHVAVGDRVTLIGSASALDPHQSHPGDALRHPLRHPVRSGPPVPALSIPVPRRSWRSRPAMWAGAVAGMLREVERALWLTLAAMAGAVLLSTTVIRLYYHLASGRSPTLLESFYFTVVTDATVGYGDFHFSGQPTWLVLFGIVDIIVGTGLAAAVFAQFTNLLVSRRLAQALGRQRATGRSGHVIVVGLGSIGMRVLEGLHARGRHAVVVEQDEGNRYLNQARALGVPVVIADAAQGDTMDLVNLADAAAVAILTSHDLSNIEIGLSIRQRLGSRWGDVPVVLRVLDRPLARTMEQNFGFHNVRSTSELAAPRCVGAALGLRVLDTFYVDHQPFLLGCLSVTEGGGLDGRAMRDLSARTRVVAISRADGSPLEHPPRRGTRFNPGDAAYIVGPSEELLLVLRQDHRLLPNPVGGDGPPIPG